MTPTAVRPRLVAMAAVAAAVVGLDQLTKTIAEEALADGPVHVVWTLYLRLTFNTGASFSIGPGMTPWLVAAAVVTLCGLLFVSRRVTSLPMALALGLVLGGATGNLCDRLFRSHGGGVIDFVDFGWWPVFNVADMAISVGAVLLVLTAGRE